MRVRCPDDAILYDFLHGQLPTADISSIDAHIDVCEECREVVIAIAGSDALTDTGDDVPTDTGDDVPTDTGDDVPTDALAATQARALDSAATIPRDAPTVDTPQSQRLEQTVPRTSPRRGDIRSRARPSRSGPLSRGDSIGRYLILDVLGRGAMGVVYAAYDPSLDRRVALKVLRRGAARAAGDRMEREAKAMARLSHANVVAIYEVGRILDTDAPSMAGSVFLAMELIEGTTLRAWLSERTRSWRDVQSIFVQIGQGLAAAHQAGIIHRDIKPDNVIIGPDDRAHVTDFGLARAHEASSPNTDTFADTTVRTGAKSGGEKRSMATAHTSPGDVSSAAPSSASRSGATPSSASRSGAPTLAAPTLTRTGTLLGTPAYMAPEQFALTRADARTDQFGYCVALFEALYGVRPFAGTTLTELQNAVERGDMVDVPRGRDVPRRIHAVVVRGLSVDPAERYRDMPALLEDFQRDPRRRYIRIAVALAVLLPALAALALFITREPSAEPVCQGARAQADRVWNDERATTIRQAFEHSSIAYAAPSARLVTGQMNDWRDRWVAMHEQTCRDTRVSGQQSEALLDTRMRCLGRQLADFDALATALEHADQTTITRAASALGSLADTTACADIDALSSLPSEPRDPDIRARLRDIETRLGTAKALLSTGKYARAESLSDELLATAGAVGYRPTLAEVTLIRAEARRERGQFDRAENDAYQALWTATEARHSRAMAHALITLTALQGARGDYRQGMRTIQLAQAVVARFERPADLQAKIDNSIGLIHYNTHDYQDAEDALERARVARVEHFGPDHLEVARSLTNLGNVARARAEYERALDYHKRALAIDEAALGSAHPNIGRHLHNLGGVYRRRGDRESAHDAYTRALAVKQNALGAEHPDVALTHNSLGLMLADAGDLARAIPQFENAARIFAVTGSAEAPLTAYNLGLARLGTGQVDKALAPLIQAVGGFRDTVGDAHPDSVRALLALGRAYRERGDRREAQRAFERARGIAARLPDARHLAARARAYLTESKPTPRPPQQPPPESMTYAPAQAWDKP